MRVDERNNGDRNIKKLLGEPRDAIECFLGRRVEDVQFMQRVETLCFLLGLEHRPVQICSLQIVTMKAWSARRERHLAYKISPILGVGAADIDLCVEYDAQEYGNCVLNSLNWCEFQPRSLIGCYLEYAKLIDPAVSCFPRGVAGRWRQGPLVWRPNRGPAARLGDEADGAGERCAGWRF